MSSIPNPGEFDRDRDSWDLRVGFDLVQISQIEASLEQFGDRFSQRIFTAEELHYAYLGDGLHAQRLAARFAAKEATIKALQLSQSGIGWRDIEIKKLQTGACEVALHDKVARLAKNMGVSKIRVSLSHEGDYAGAMVTAFLKSSDSIDSRGRSDEHC